MLALTDRWVWAFWLVDDGTSYHVFFLQAPRALHDAELRHTSATVGHAISGNLVDWAELGDALVPASTPAFDDLAIWTGSTVRGDDGSWYLFYTGASRAERGLVQRIGLARSSDLHRWERTGTAPLLAADPCWYETLATGQWHHEAWRDPLVVRDPHGNGWHMLLTARANRGNTLQRGVIGHATSDDLLSWRVQPPLSDPDQGFAQLEDLSLHTIAGKHVLLFSCHSADVADGGRTGGIWVVAGSSPVGKWRVRDARRISDESLYCGRVIDDRSGAPVLLGFHNMSSDGHFVGTISDPIPLTTGHGGAVALACNL